MIKWRNKSIENADVSQLRKNWQAYLILSLAVGSMTFFGVCTPTGQQMIGPSGTAASVDGDDISAITFRRAHINQSQRYQQQFKGDFDPISMGLSQAVVDQLVEQRMLYQVGVRNGLYAGEDEIAKLIIDGGYFKGENGKFSSEVFQRFLKSQLYTEKSFTDELRQDIVTNKLRSFLTATYSVSSKEAELDYKLNETKLNLSFIRIDPKSVEVEVSKEEIDEFLKSADSEKAVESYYNRNKSQYNQEAQVRARHILIGFKEARRASGEAANRSKEDARELARKVLAEVKKENSDFTALAKKYTDEPGGRDKGGNLGYFKFETMVKEFSEVAFAMTAGQVSDIVETPFGFHIIKVEDVKKAKSVSLDQAKSEIAQKLVEEKKKPKLVEETAKKVHSLATAEDDDALKNLGYEWKNSGEFALSARFIPGGLGDEDAIKQAVFSLKKPGQVAPEPLKVSNGYVVVKLKDRKPADMSAFDEEKSKQLSSGLRFRQAFTLYNQFTDWVKKDYEKRKLIYRNPEFLNYDQKMQQMRDNS